MFRSIKQPLSYNERLKGRVINASILLIPKTVTKIQRVSTGTCSLEDISAGDVVDIKGRDFITIKSKLYDFQSQADTVYMEFNEITE